eukprot:201554-Pleurochrysis_carterae.AAC.1
MILEDEAFKWYNAKLTTKIDAIMKVDRHRKRFTHEERIEVFKYLPSEVLLSNEKLPVQALPMKYRIKKFTKINKIADNGSDEVATNRNRNANNQNKVDSSPVDNGESKETGSSHPGKRRKLVKTGGKGMKASSKRISVSQGILSPSHSSNYNNPDYVIVPVYDDGLSAMYALAAALASPLSRQNVDKWGRPDDVSALFETIIQDKTLLEGLRNYIAKLRNSPSAHRSYSEAVALAMLNSYEITSRLELGGYTYIAMVHDVPLNINTIMRKIYNSSGEVRYHKLNANTPNEEASAHQAGLRQERLAKAFMFDGPFQLRPKFAQTLRIKKSAVMRGFFKALHESKVFILHSHPIPDTDPQTNLYTPIIPRRVAKVYGYDAIASARNGAKKVIRPITAISGHVGDEERKGAKRLKTGNGNKVPSNTGGLGLGIPKNADVPSKSKKVPSNTKTVPSNTKKVPSNTKK